MDISLEQFKKRLPLAEIVGRYVKLNKHGREYQGLCPFHQEKTPSFYVVEEKGFYHCFGCGKHGDAISFVSEVEGLSFAQALVRLGDIAGIEPPSIKNTEPEVSPSLLDANAAAGRYFQTCLHDTGGRSARDYLAGRGIAPTSIEQFQLGCAGENRQGLLDWLSERGIGPDTAVEAGLAIRPEGGGQPYDRFRQRLMIPIEDQRGRIVGFGGRALAEQKAKYLNSPETPIFHKGDLLYNLKRASVASRQNKRLIVVEGYLDVIALAEADIAETVAPLGTAITDDQLRHLWRLCPKPSICLDGDRAGRAAALRLAKKALGSMKSGQSLEFLPLPDGEDPDSLVRSRGPDALFGLLRNALPLSRLIWLEESNREPSDTPEQLAALRRRLFEYVEETQDGDLKRALKDQFFSLLDARRPQRRHRGNANRERTGSRQKAASQWEGTGRLPAVIDDLETRRSCRLVGYFLRSDEILQRHGDRLAEVKFKDRAAEAARQEILQWYSATDALDADDLAHHLTRHGHDRVMALSMEIVPEFGSEALAEIEHDIERLFEMMAASAAREMAVSELVGEIEARSIEKAEAARLVLNQLVNANGDRSEDR